MKKTKTVGFVVCLAAAEGEDLVTGKLYRVLADAKAATAGCLRVIDESGEDYLYPERRFIFVKVPEESRLRLSKAIKKSQLERTV